MADILEVTLLVVFLLGVFAVSNAVHSRGLPFFVSRKVAHVGAGLALLALPWLFVGPMWPVALSLGFLLLLAATHRTNIWHGFARTGRVAELAFAFSCFLSLLLLWGRDPWLAVVPPLFMAFGDAATGIVRFRVYKKEVKGWWGSLACLGVCSAIALLVQPLWVGLAGAVAFTVTEKLCGDVGVIHIDDNLAAPLAAMAVMEGLYALL